MATPRFADHIPRDQLVWGNPRPFVTIWGKSMENLDCHFLQHSDVYAYVTHTQSSHKTVAEPQKNSTCFINTRRRVLNLLPPAPPRRIDTKCRTEVRHWNKKSRFQKQAHLHTSSNATHNYKVFNFISEILSERPLCCHCWAGGGDYWWLARPSEPKQQQHYAQWLWCETCSNLRHATQQQQQPEQKEDALQHTGRQILPENVNILCWGSDERGDSGGLN